MFRPAPPRSLSGLGPIAAAAALIAAPAAHASTFMDTLANVSGTYNAYTSGSFSSSNSDTEGKIAAGGSVDLKNYSVGLKNKGGDAVVAGGGISLKNGTIYGNAISGGSASYTGVNISGGTASAGGPIGGSSAPYIGKSTYTGLPLDFAATTADLVSASAYLGSADAQSQGVLGAAVKNYSTLNLTSTATSGLVFFDVTAAQLANINLSFHVSSSATVIVNVTGQTSGKIGAGGFDGVTAGQTLFNFVDASNLNLASFNGSILAPNAAISASNGRIDGSVMAKSYNGATQINWVGYKGGLPTVSAVPEPASWAMMILGVGAVGGVLRRRRRLANAAALASA